MPQKKYDTFDPAKVMLSGSNLIEASAGTGKTYSIALMALRLIVEKDIPVQHILMVTFTKAAVAELEQRVRSFVRLALKACCGNPIEDSTIEALVRTQIDKHSAALVEQRLRNAQLFLDETAVLTIHSFCQKVLSEYSFETAQVFSAEAMSPDEMAVVVEDSFHEFWRQKITTLPIELLNELLQAGLNRVKLLDQVNYSLGGKHSALQDSMPADFLSMAHIGASQVQLIKEQKETELKYLALVEYLNLHKQDLCQKLEVGNANARKAFLQDLQQEDFEQVIDTIIDKAEVKYLQGIFGSFIEEVLAYDELMNQRKKRLGVFVNHIGVKAAQWVYAQLTDYKKKQALITFDDMIGLLHKALQNGPAPGTLIKSLREKYKAVFIDEFQDTDKEQYDIFQKLFGSNHILFFIGDPKQSIYGWRKADIYTYFAASDAVDAVHQMNINHRSTKAFIDAMNSFFLPEPSFDTFANAGSAHPIKYIPVKSPEPNNKGKLLEKGKEPEAIRISLHPNKPQIQQAVLNIVQDVLAPGNYVIQKNGMEKSVTPSDIGILVRSNREGREIKNLLASRRIPAVTIDDSKLLTSDEAKDLYHIMVAVHDVSRSNINKALFTNLGAYTREMLLEADEEAILQRFRVYQETWKTEGVYVMFRRFLADHGFTEILNRDKLTRAERVLSNVLQLIEVIHKIAQRKNFSTDELIQWLKKATEGRVKEGDEYEQRIESDEEAVKIVTIHKSKGLEYNIVIAPHLDMVASNSKDHVLSFRNPEDGKYYSGLPHHLNENQKALAGEQNEQENRRLLYVAITRARYMCFITASSGKFSANSSLRKFIQIGEEGRSPRVGIEYRNPVPPDSTGMLKGTQESFIRQYAKASNFKLKQIHWRKASYSALNPEHEISSRHRYNSELKNEYEQFVFKELRKGAHTGNLLHYIFEHLDFSNQTYWPQVVERALKRLSSGNKDEKYALKIFEMLNHLSRVKLGKDEDFCLEEVKRNQKLAEFEFNFPLGLMSTGAIEALSTPQVPLFVRNNEELEGIMNGKIDLFFECNGKYYVLDWKSNHLGDTLEDYNAEALGLAMAENNYHLQYHLYTLAVCKYLSLKLPDFNYERDFGGAIYLFVRGVRQGENTGIFHHKPSLEIMQKLNQICCGTKDWLS